MFFILFKIKNQRKERMEELKWENVPKGYTMYKEFIEYFEANKFSGETRKSYVKKFSDGILQQNYGNVSEDIKSKMYKSVEFTFSFLQGAGYLQKVSKGNYKFTELGVSLYNDRLNIDWEKFRQDINQLMQARNKSRKASKMIKSERFAFLKVMTHNILDFIQNRLLAQNQDGNIKSFLKLYVKDYETQINRSLSESERKSIFNQLYKALLFLRQRGYLEDKDNGYILTPKGIDLYNKKDPDWYTTLESEYQTKPITTSISDVPDESIYQPKKVRRNDEELMYPMLTEYLEEVFDLKSMRIDEKRSKNNRGQGGNTWLHPDIVAMQPMPQNMSRIVKNCISNSSGPKMRLWSFEVKLELNVSNIRKCFFQAVSNSSWANEGYLVTNRIKDETTAEELRMLSALHGIGVIVLDTINPINSSIVLPANPKPDVDWKSVDRIVKENKDFVEYIESVDTYLQTGKVRDGDWD